jgi:hypothetical protein
MASLAEVDELEDPGLGEPSREGLADDGERGSRDERELIAALACAGDTTFGPCCRGFGPRRPSLAPCSLTIVCEVIEGAGPHQPPGNRNRDGKAERPDS